MRYMVIEGYRDPVQVYRRVRDEGRLLPEGLRYIDSWVTPDLTRCYQVMECEGRHVLDTWMDRWSDLVEFTIIPVISSREASATIAARL